MSSRVDYWLSNEIKAVITGYILDLLRIGMTAAHHHSIITSYSPMRTSDDSEGGLD